MSPNPQFIHPSPSASSTNTSPYTPSNSLKMSVRQPHRDPDLSDISNFTPPASTKRTQPQSNHPLLDLSHDLLSYSSTSTLTASNSNNNASAYVPARSASMTNLNGNMDLDSVEDDPRRWVESILKETLLDDDDDDNTDSDNADFKEGIISEELLKFDFNSPNTIDSRTTPQSTTTTDIPSTVNSNKASALNVPSISSPLSNELPKLPLPKPEGEKIGNPATDTTEGKIKAYNLLRSGLIHYNQLLKYAHAEDTICTRADFLIKYVQDKSGFKLRPKSLIEYFGQVRHEEKYTALCKEVGDTQLVGDVKNLLHESERRRKCYNKRKSTKAERDRKSGLIPSSSSSNNQPQPLPMTPTHPSLQQQTPPNAAIAMQNLQQTPSLPKTSVRDLLLDLIKIGYVSHDLPDDVPPPFHGLAELNSTIRVFEDEKYIHELHNKNSNLKYCIEDLFTKNISINHSLMYTRVPLTPDQDMSVDLTTDRMIAYVVCLLDMSPFLSLNDVISDDNFSRLIQLKSITKLYIGENLIYKKIEPTTGYVIPGSLKAKINIPLQTKYWAGAINDYSNGAIDDTDFNEVRMVHTLIPDDDMVKLRIEKDQPIASFIWEFFVNSIPGYVPHSVLVWKDIPFVNEKRDTNMIMQPPPFKILPNNKLQRTSSLNARQQFKLGRGHKRTRSRSLNELDRIQHIPRPSPLYQQLQANRSVDAFETVGGTSSLNSPMSPFDPRFVSPDSITSAPPSQLSFNLAGTPDSNHTTFSYNDRASLEAERNRIREQQRYQQQLFFKLKESANQNGGRVPMSSPNTPILMQSTPSHPQQQQQQQQQQMYGQFQVQPPPLQQQQQQPRTISLSTTTTITPQLQQLQFINDTVNNSSSSDLSQLQPPPRMASSNHDVIGASNGDHGSPTSTISVMSSDSVDESMNINGGLLYSNESLMTSTGNLTSNSNVSLIRGVGNTSVNSNGPAVTNNNNATSNNNKTVNSPLGSKSAANGNGDDVRFFFYRPPAPHS